MKRYEVVGIREVEYVGKKGQKVVGRMLYVQYCRDDTVGVAVMEMFVFDTGAADVCVGDMVTPLYNQWGRIEGVINHGAATV